MNKIKEYIVPENHIYESFDDMLNGPFKEQAGSLVVLLHDHNEEIKKLKEENDRLKNYEINGFIIMLNEMKEEIIKIKKENENLKRIIAKDLNENDEFGAEFVHVNILKNEISKLKKSREVLRQACEFYGDIDNWDIYKNKGYEYFNFTFQRINKNDLEAFAIGIDMADRYGGKKAREAIKQDDEIMK